MEISIIKQKSGNNWIYILSLSLILSSCKNLKNTDNQGSSAIKLYEMDFSEYNLSSSKNNIANNEIKNYFESTYKYDVLYYSGKSGDSDYSLDRWFSKSNDVFVHLKIVNEKESINEIKVTENDIKFLFDKLDSKSYMGDCNGCYGSYFGLLLIKNENKFFKYNHYGVFYNDLQQSEKEKIIHAIEIFNFFKSK
jgi:hypothetical protein